MLLMNEDQLQFWKKDGRIVTYYIYPLFTFTKLCLNTEYKAKAVDKTNF